MTALLTGLGLTLTMAQPAAALPDCRRPDPPPICNPVDPEDPPAPGNLPVLHVDGVQQTPSRSGVHVWGWTADADAPTTPLTVDFQIDGASAGSVVASVSRPDVAAAFPRLGDVHGFDLTLPASADGHHVCATAVNVGSGRNKTVCGQMDEIAEFEAFAIKYDTDRAVLTGTSLQQLDQLTIRNGSAIQQSTEISDTRTVKDTHGWSDTETGRVTVSTSFRTGLPIFAEGKVTVTVEGSASYTHNGSTETTRTFSWKQPVLVPARSIMAATVTITISTIRVPYTLIGEYIFRSGVRAAGTVNGTYTGGNSHNLQVSLTQFNLDGTLAAAPVEQPPATMLEVSEEQ